MTRHELDPICPYIVNAVTWDTVMWLGTTHWEQHRRKEKDKAMLLGDSVKLAQWDKTRRKKTKNMVVLG